MGTHSTVDISLQGREYRVTCAPEERDALFAAVTFVESKMNEIAARTRGSGERLAVMTALNLAHELLENKADPLPPQPPSPPVAPPPTPATPAVEAETNFDSKDFARRINSMVARLDAVMSQQESLL